MEDDMALASSCLIVLNSHRSADTTSNAIFAQAAALFERTASQVQGRAVAVRTLQLREPSSINGNLTGYLRAHAEVLRVISAAELAATDMILYIHDAGLATRVFPLSYESGTPSKGSIKFPNGSGLETLLVNIAKNLPLLRGCVAIVPIDQYFSYDPLDLDALLASVARHSISLILTPVPIERAIGSLGVVDLSETGQIERFVEKPTDPGSICETTPGQTLANTLQLYTRISELAKLQSALDDFSARPENRGYVTALDQCGWSLSHHIFETLTQPRAALSPIQEALHASLCSYGFTLGGIVAIGSWEDWASSGRAYAALVKQLVRASVACDANGNSMLRSRNVKASGQLTRCIFIDCDTIDLLGDYEDCLFVNCNRIRLMNCESATNSLFYGLRDVNFLRRDMSNYLYSRFLSGQRYIEFECELSVNTASLYQMMNRLVQGWEHLQEQPPRVRAAP